ncbi:hypothetical protein FSS13T_01070 [Flavobacterium saliperosum S13]|uniref:Uncharacterized protein n=1 Tax=Flavobacterium saliperosum S13 TaxID=1341155 RepID=A0ABP2ZYL4_9FLAO|nr:hypothetical protein FSS13T_01070 [Flavobacterium saliperosum S13]
MYHVKLLTEESMRIPLLKPKNKKFIISGSGFLKAVRQGSLFS